LKLSDGAQIGTLCFMDSFSEIEIDEEDVRFMSLLAMRVSAEKERERAIDEREAAQRLVLESQARDLESTRHVLNAMNQAFALVGTQDDLNQTIASQTKILRGAIGYDRVGIFCSVTDGAGLFGHVAKGDLGTQTHFLDSSSEFRGLFESEPNMVIPLKLLPGRAGFLVLASSGQEPVRSSLHEAHIEAITEQVSLLLAARMLQAELDRTDQELAATQSRLIQTEKLSVVGTLAASTAHDIKNILSSISVELGFVDEDPHRTLASVRAHMDRFSVLAHRLLSYSKPRMVAMGAVDLHQVIQRVLALTSGHIRVTNVDVVLEEPSSLPKVAGDPHQLDHMFVNLVLNAVQAMHDKGGTLTVRTAYRGDRVEVEIQDTGQGMSPETLQRLFEPFLSTRTDGFGLGLFSCRRIVEEQGGSITARSEPGKGTTFTVKLKPAGGGFEP
jgi:signal transduction histidine kinase